MLVTFSSFYIYLLLLYAMSIEYWVQFGHPNGFLPWLSEVGLFHSEKDSAHDNF